METLVDIFEPIGVGVGAAAIVFLCVIGMVLSCLSISGTWSVLAATIIAAIITGASFPGWKTVFVFGLICVLVEVVEFGAGYWGVTKRGGSKEAGVAAVAGGLFGLVLGGFIPIPVVGSVLGMLAGSFGLAFLIERERIKRSDRAAEIAVGAVLARVWVIFFKVIVTLGMIMFLVVGLVINT
jgi:uncharacterized protein YqgC (DUF456 family)